MPLDLNADITALRGAEYNPRHIGPDEREMLKASISAIGLVKPLIARNNLIVAGHQRTNALLALGQTTGAVYSLDRNTTVFDEVRFNQLHNGTDTDSGDENAHLSGFDRVGYQVVDSRSVSGNMRGSHAVIRAEMCQMILNFGPWGGCVATKSGKIIHAAQYALAAKITGTPLTVCVIPDDLETTAMGFLVKSYGRFSYDHLERKTYIQSMAQMFRLRNSTGGKQNKSNLYEGHVMPWLADNPNARVLDFGSGFGDYASALRGRGQNVHDVVLFRRKSGANVIDRRAVNLMIDKLCDDISGFGPYDAVVLDSVMNSFDSAEAERHTFAVCNAFTKPGGRFFFSGRPREAVDRRINFTKSVQNRRRTYVNFMDDLGFSASYRQGAWFYQRFHSKDMIEAAADGAGFRIDKHVPGLNAFQVEATKVASLDASVVEAAVRFEFNLPWGSSSRIGRDSDVMKAVASATSGERH